MNFETDEEQVLNPTDNETFESVVRRRISRRDALKGAAGAMPLLVLGAGVGLGSELLDAEPAEAAGFTFVPISGGSEDRIVVPAGYESQVLLQWGESLFEGINDMGSDRGALNQTADLQNLRVGYNHDFLGYFPLPMGSKNSTSGVLTINHEYTNPELMFPGYTAATTRKDIVDVELAAHGMSIVEISQDENKKWGHIMGSRYTRRITGETPMDITGPAAGSQWLKTTADTTGTKVRGMLNNCGGGKTPWGTVLTAEENFNQYFGNLNGLPTSDPRRALHQRYGLTAGASERAWEKFYNRFDIAKEPNEPFRYGWIVEIDPYNASSTPKKRTALGRLKHEAANGALAKSGQYVVYTGDDERFDYMYKFVTEGKYDKDNRSANMNLLDKGTLYVAKFNDDGSGRWLPMVYGEGPLTKANGFQDQADVLINTRGAADLLGATKMDRPEDIEVNPVNGKVYMALTNNTNRTAAQVDRSNPRANNRHGHIMEFTEDGNDYAAMGFRWTILLLAGDPKAAADSANYAGFDASLISPLSCPDNIAFDTAGNLWIATDGQPGTVQKNDGLFAVPVSGFERGRARQFLYAPKGSETASLEFTPDSTTIFTSIQHPGEGGSRANPTSTWPNNEWPPRPAVVAVVKRSEGVIGS